MGFFEYNKDIKLRDTMIFGEYDFNAYCDGIREFKGMNFDTLDWLIANEFVDSDDYSEYTPTVETFSNFMYEHPGFYVDGYVYSLDRKEYRVVIDAIYCDHEIISDKKTLVTFIDMFRNADEFSVVDGVFARYY